MTTERPELHILPFSVIRDTLDRLLVAMINRLDRDCPKGITQIPGAQPFFLVAIEAAKNCYDAIRWLTSSKPQTPLSSSTSTSQAPFRWRNALRAAIRE